MPMHLCFRATDNVPQAAQIVSPHVRPRILHLWVSVEMARRLAHTLIDLNLRVPQKPESIIALAIPAHLFRDGEEPRLGKQDEGAGLVDAQGAPV